MKKEWLALIMVGATLGSTLASEDLPMPPQEPILRKLASQAAWRVVYPAQEEPAGENQRKPARLQEVLIRRGNGLRHEQQRWNDGATTDRWFEGSVLVFSLRANPELFVYHNKPNADAAVRDQFADFESFDFPELAWISPQNCKGVVRHQDRFCYLFEEEAVRHLESGMAPVKIQKRAWVDGMTGQPVALEVNSRLRAYHFDQPAPANLQMSGKFRERLTVRKEAKP